MKTDSSFNRLLWGMHLTEAESERLFLDFFQSALGDTRRKAVLLMLARKGETPSEVSGCLRALNRLEPKPKKRIRNLLDTCGTGGDSSHSLNVSTLAALIIAGAGGRVAKHGNRGLSSKCGSSDLMEALGVKLDAKPSQMIKAIQKTGMGYFHAPYYHPIFSKVQPLRRALRVRTIFNLLGPLANPVGVERQLIGVAKKELLMLYAEVLKRKGVKKALVCHSEDGMDEISTAAPSHLIWIQNKKMRHQKLNPEKLGIKRADKKSYRGGNANKNRGLALRLLQNRLRGPLRDLVLLNAAAGLMVSGKAAAFKEGLRLAEQSLVSGRAYRALQNLKRISND